MNPLLKLIPSLILGNPNGYPQVLVYKDYDKYGDLYVAKMPLDYVDRTCRRLGTSTDDLGRKLAPGSIRACYDYNQNILWTAGNLSIEHELCHRDNPPRWDGKTWVYDNNCDDVHTEAWR